MKKYFRVTTIVLALLTIMYLITYLDRVNVSSAAAGFGKEFNLTKTEIGLVFSAFAWPYLAFQLVGGWVSDRFGAKRTLVVCGIVWGVATILTGFSGGLISMILTRILLGLGEGATFPAATAAMSRWVPAEKRGFAQGITHAGSRFGNAVAPAFVVMIMAMYGWREAFIACGILSLAWVVLFAWVFTENPQDHKRITPEELAALPAPKPKPPAVPFRRLFKRMWPVTMIYFTYGWTLWLFLSWMPQYFLHNYNMNLKSSAIFASAVFFAGVIGDTLGGIISDKILVKTGNLKHARTTMISVCMTLSLLSLLPMFFYHDAYVSMACLAIAFFLVELTIGVFWAIPMDIAPEYSGTASGLMNIGSSSAAILSPVVAGYLIDKTGNWDLPFMVSMGLMVFGIVFAHIMRPQDQFIAYPNAEEAVNKSAT